MFIMQWVPGTYPIPFFQTWCCENSSITPLPSPSPSPGNWRDLKYAGLPPKMYDCVRDNLLMNRVGVDCIHYLFNDDECRAFIAREYPSDVLDAYDNLIPTAFKADLWRYCVLYMYGGVYLDIKLQFCGGGGRGVLLRSIVERLTGGGGDGGGGDGGGGEGGGGEGGGEGGGGDGGGGTGGGEGGGGDGGGGDGGGGDGGGGEGGGGDGGGGDGGHKQRT